MEQRITKFISVIFHPLLIPFYTFSFLFNDNGYYSRMILFNGKLILEGLLLLTTVILPFLSCYFMLKRKMILSLSFETKEERIYPLLTVAIFYYLTYYLLKGIHISQVFSYIMLGLTFLVICAMIISFFYKISLYMISIGTVSGLSLGLTLGQGADMMLFFLVTIFLSGVIATVRIMNNSHKSSEIYSGFLLGFTVLFLLFYLI
jgi:hypothetical protein